MYEYDRRYGEWVVGADEAGRGALAGSLVAAAVCWPTDGIAIAVDDSKRLTPKRREELSREVLRHAHVGWCVISPPAIDEYGVHAYNLLALERAVETAEHHDATRLVDWYPVDGAVSMAKGDRVSAAIAAASIMAKTLHDRLMCSVDRHYPQYGWAQNQGYGSPAHRRAIAEHGLSPEHRRSFCTRLSPNA